MTAPYKLLNGLDGILYTDDTGLVWQVPRGPGAYWEAYQAWLASGKVPDPVDAPPEPNLADVKTAQKAKINDSATNAINAAISDYPDFERLTWSTQQNESALWEAAAPEARLPELVPWCASAAANRVAPGGAVMALADFMALVKGNVAAFTELSSVTAGKRQTYRDKIDAAPNRQAVEAIVWGS